MNGNQQTESTHGRDDICLLGLPSPMELAIIWGGKERSFEIVEFSANEVVVAGISRADLDLRMREASIQYCDDELMDEVVCSVRLRSFEGRGMARFRIHTSTGEDLEVARIAEVLRSRIELRRDLEQARLAVACGWL